MVAALEADADGAAVSLPALLIADLTRYRALADAAIPQMTEWEWCLISHVMSGVESLRILGGDDGLPAPLAIAAEIDTWADGAQDDDCLRAGKLRERVMTWSPLAIAGVLMRLRRAG